jgi:hypothetical protein
MNQGELFSNLQQDENPLVDGVVCIKCGERQPISKYTVMKAGEIKRTCRSCKNGSKKIITQLKLENAYPDKNYKCLICLRSLEELSKHNQIRLKTWVLDHCHDTNTFRGWVCHKCNTGLGGFRDDLTILKNAVRYMEKHKETLNDEQTTND